MVFGIVCLCIAGVALVLCPICGRAADPVLALPLFFAFLILLVAGILSLIFDSAVAGIVAIIVIALWLLSVFFP